MIDRVFVAPKGTEVEEGLQFAQAHGLGYEIPTFLNPAVLDRRDEETQRYVERLQSFKGLLSLHGPVFDMNPVSLDPGILHSSRSRYAQAVDVCHDLGARYIVFHSQYTPIYRVANVMNDWLSATVDFWQELIDTKVKGTPLTLLVENFLDETPDMMNEVLDRVNSPHLKACLDTGHINLFSRMTPMDWLDAFGTNVVHIHAHNNQGQRDDHFAFNRGTLDLEAFLNHVALSRHKLGLVLEVFSMAGIRESYEILLPFLEMQQSEQAVRSFLL